jgi:hypothetical protein
MRNRTALRAVLRKMSKGVVRRSLGPFTGVTCTDCGSYARVVGINKSRGGGTQVICNSDNTHRR